MKRRGKASGREVKGAVRVEERRLLPFLSKYYDNLNTVFVRKVGRLEILDSFSKSLSLVAPDSLEFAGGNGA